MAIAILASLNMQAVTTKLTQKGDTSYIIEGKDTTILIKGIPAAIAKHINDTLVNNDKDSDSEVAGSDVIDKQGSNAKNEEALHKFMLEEEREQAQMAAGITAIVFFSIFAIIVVILLFNFLHRRAKYRVIEKAIDNNYPLPGTFMGSNDFAKSNSTQNVNQAQPGYAAAHQPAANGALYWPAFKGSFTLMAVGLGLMLFFMFCGSMEMFGACSIILFIGIGKAVIIYNDQKSAIARGPQRTTVVNNRAQQPPVFTQPQQTASNQPSNDQPQNDQQQN